MNTTIYRVIRNASECVFQTPRLSEAIKYQDSLTAMTKPGSGLFFHLERVTNGTDHSPVSRATINRTVAQNS